MLSRGFLMLLLTMCPIPRSTVSSTTWNHSPTFSFVLLFSSLPKTALWCIPCAVLYSRHVQPGSLPISSSDGVYLFYCRKTNSPPLLFVSLFTRSICNAFTINCAFCCCSSPVIYRIVFLVPLLGPRFLFAYTRWILFHSFGLSRLTSSL